MEKITIKSSLYDYDVELVDDFSETLQQFGECCTYVIDNNVYNLYRDKFQFIDSENVFPVEAVESKKNIETVLEVIEFWRMRSVKKNWKVICIGGGIVQDITTFASNIYLRNVEWYFFPTTLLAMSDSCIGGKCGINLHEVKNQLGVFYPPKKIYICDKFLRTLSEDDYINGWGELLKFSLTENKEFYDELSSEESYIPCEKIKEYIYKGLMVKKNVIEEDEFESDRRRILNYGHTFGHALEAYTQNVIPHGKAVIWGIDVVNYIAYKEGVLQKEIYQNIKSLIKRAFIKEEIVIDNPNSLFELIRTDKKVKNNTIYLAVPDRLSHLIIYPMEINHCLKELLKGYLEDTHGYYNS